MIAPAARPSTLQSALVVGAVGAGWVYLRLYVFPDQVFPITYVLPLMIGVWSCRLWHVWAMALAFVAATVVKHGWLLPDDPATAGQRALLFGTTLFNIAAGAIVVHFIVNLRARLRVKLERIVAQNSELEAQAEELSQQNEEITAQAEELAQQHEEIESQSEELTAQNEELHDANEVGRQREEILQGILEAARTPETGKQALAEVCRRALRILGKPVDAIAILSSKDSGLYLQVQASIEGEGGLPAAWPVEGSICGVVLAENKTAYVSALRKEPRVAAPFVTTDPVQSVLATPLHVAGVQRGVVVASSRQESHWTRDQFRVIEWVAAQCGLITESMEWQEELARRAEEIAAANRAKDQFLAMLSHELRTPLTPVLAVVGELENDPRLPADARDDLQMIRRNVTIQSRLIDDLLDLTKLERGKIDLNLELLDVSKLLTETAAIVSPELDAKAQQLNLALQPADGCTVSGDGARLQQVFWNLLKNAIKFSPARGQISITTERLQHPSPRLKIEVVDSGIGIGPEDQKRIFLPFEQVVAGGRHRTGDAGLGLGLAIAKAIVELHHGVISAHSRGVGRGATFSVELPLVTREAAAAAPALPPATLTRKERSATRILLVEDHGDTGRVLCRLLRAAGYLVEHSETGAGGLALAAKAPFDLVVSDLGLPDISGLELLPKLRAICPGIRGICISGYGMDRDLQACSAVGFSEHLTKPVDLQRLQAAIARVATQPAG